MQYSFHNPIVLNNLTISFGNKECISGPFTHTIYYGEKIGIIGRNGSGKTSLLKALCGLNTFYEGDIVIPEDLVLGYIPQLILDGDIELSGGQRFNQQLSQALSLHPNILLLDEPTNHLDRHNRDALFGLLKRYQGTLIVITHDVELLNFVDTIWHVFNRKINVFNGSYHEYTLQQKHGWDNLTNAVKKANLEKKIAHEQLMREQDRVKKKKIYGEKKYDGDKLALRSAQGRGQLTANKNNKRIELNRQNAIDQLQELFVPETITPKFHLTATHLSANKSLLSIENGMVSYLMGENNILTNINLQLGGNEKIALHGDNGSGKSTLLKAIMSHDLIIKDGSWLCPNIEDIGYVDQHYSNLSFELTAIDLLEKIVPSWSYAEIRNHLNIFLLRKNEEVNLAIKYLSGGEKARLSLALISAKPPKLLILDEITNNIDLETKEHLIQVLSNYPGGMILVCHDINFMNSLTIDKCYMIKNGKLQYL